MDKVKRLLPKNSTKLFKSLKILIGLLLPLRHQIEEPFDANLGSTLILHTQDIKGLKRLEEENPLLTRRNHSNIVMNWI